MTPRWGARGAMAWHETPLRNKVYEAIKRLSRNGEVPVPEPDIISYLNSMGVNISKKDLVNALIVLEQLGYIVVSSSTKDERLIKLVKS